MEKNGQLFDDSVLVKALDDAISKYKIMHTKGGDHGSPKEERIVNDAEESVPSVFSESNEAKSACVKTNDITDLTVTEKCTSEPVEQHGGALNGDQIQDSDCNNVNAENAEHYNRLLNQYNAVEEQRQKLLEQLYQYGNWDPQSYGYAYGADYGYSAGYDSQYHTVSATQPSGPPTCTCPPYVCPYSAAVPHNENSVSVEDDCLIKAAMGAVDKAIHSIDKETSGILDVDKEGKKEQEVETTSQTDLSVVLNAWFSAGFHTGKYLSKQASAKK